MSTRPEIHYVVLVFGKPKISYATAEDAHKWVTSNNFPAGAEVLPVPFVLYPTWGLAPQEKVD